MTPVPSTRHVAPVTAVALVGSVVGVGALFLPAYSVARSGAALYAWAYQLLAGGLLVAALSLAVRARPAGPGSAPAVLRFTAEVLGTAGRAVRWYYLIGVSVGQAVVAALGGWFVARAVGRPEAWPLPAALTLIGAAVAAALGQRGRIGPPAGLLAVTVLAALPVAASLPVPDAVGTVPGGVIGFAAVTYTLTFAFVGWESAAGLTGERAAARCGTGLGVGVAVIAVVYLGLALLAQAGVTGAWPPGTIRAGAALAGVLCALACVRNLAAVAALSTGPVPAAANGRGRTAAVLLAAGVAGIALALVATHRRALTDVLAVPNAMALAVFITAALAVLIRGPRMARACAAPALLGYVLLLPFGGPTVLTPFLVLLAVAVWARVRGAAAAQPLTPRNESKSLAS